MDQMWKFEAEDGWHLCLRLEKENHCLRLEAEHDGCLWKLYAQDMLDNTEDHPSSFLPGNAAQGPVLAVS